MDQIDTLIPLAAEHGLKITAPQDSAVPCNGCTACCENELVFLQPEYGDDPSKYETYLVENPLTGKREHALRQKLGGGCWYLEKGVGCTIHERAPVYCRIFDCRRAVAMFEDYPKKLRRALLKNGLIDKRVLRAGRNRRASL